MTTPKHTVENCEILAGTIAATMSQAQLREFASKAITQRLIKNERAFEQNLADYWDYIPDGEERDD